MLRKGEAKVLYNVSDLLIILVQGYKLISWLFGWSLLIDLFTERGTTAMVRMQDLHPPPEKSSEKTWDKPKNPYIRKSEWKVVSTLSL